MSNMLRIESLSNTVYRHSQDIARRDTESKSTQLTIQKLQNQLDSLQRQVNSNTNTSRWNYHLIDNVRDGLGPLASAVNHLYPQVRASRGDAWQPFTTDEGRDWALYEHDQSRMRYYALFSSAGI